MKFLLTLLVASGLTLHAENEKEFCERVAKAWNSKNAAEILALYGDPAKLDPDFKNQITTGMIDFKLKSGYLKVDATLLPPDPTGNKSFVTKGKIMYSPSEPVGIVKVAFVRDENSKFSGGDMSMSFNKVSDGSFALVSPAVKSFEWTGGDMTSFNVQLKSDKDGAFIPQAIIVVEKYGHLDWLTTGKSLSFPAHKVVSLIVFPTPDSESLTVEITKGMEWNPVFKKTVNSSKGAVIPIESVTP
jgi:hypothetical protein